MAYLVNEIFYTLQGEGHWTGRAAVFCRFSRCNLWSGHEADRSTAICQFCDTDFTSYTEYEAAELAALIKSAWRGDDSGQSMVVFTGGEPALQLDEELLQHFGPDWYTAVETNGTVPLQTEVDWVCVSPKTPKIHVRQGDELKLVFPQRGRVQPKAYEDLGFNVFWLSPMDGDWLEENTRAAVVYATSHPLWRVNIQTHKILGVR